jgi:hypothetical protein
MMGGCANKKIEKPIAKKVTKTIQHLDLSKINYPKKVGSYDLYNKESLKGGKAGIMIRYVDYNNSKAFLDCYIYPQGNETNISAHYQDFMAGLKFMLKQKELKKLKVLKEDSVQLNKKTIAKRTLFEMENKSVSYYSTLYLAPMQDHYFKVRLSNPLKEEFLNSDLGEKTVKELFNKIKFNQ